MGGIRSSFSKINIGQGARARAIKFAGQVDTILL
jgi:hypothetical protein